MASTNKTTNYELSQFVGTDKPAWLSDYNGDMSKIDAGINTAQTTATGADGKADANATKIGTLANLTTTVKTDTVSAINEVNTLAGSANTAAGTALSTANAAGAKADTALNNIAKFNLTNFSTLTPSTNLGTASEVNVKFASDSTSSVFKVYGSLRVTVSNSQSGSCTVTLGTTSLRPTESYTIDCAAMLIRNYRNGETGVYPRSITVGTNGVITVQTFTLNGSDTASAQLLISPCLYFNADFGDTPTPDA